MYRALANRPERRAAERFVDAAHLLAGAVLLRRFAGGGTEYPQRAAGVAADRLPFLLFGEFAFANIPVGTCYETLQIYSIICAAPAALHLRAGGEPLYFYPRS